MARASAAHYSASELLPGAVLSDFYREEFLKHLDLLRLQREYYSEPAVACAEAALDRILGQFEALCTMRDADLMFSRLLRSLDLVTGVSALSDPKKAH